MAIWIWRDRSSRWVAHCAGGGGEGYQAQSGRGIWANELREHTEAAEIRPQPHWMKTRTLPRCRVAVLPRAASAGQ